MHRPVLLLCLVTTLTACGKSGDPPAAKARARATDLGPDHIRVNTVLPGWVMTERQLKLWVNAAAEELIDRSQCLPGRLQPVDLARMALFLAADDSHMCTAQEFTVDGGWV